MARKALIVGINQYDGDPLAYCVKDAIAIRQVLELDSYNFDCTLLTDADATAPNIRTELEHTLSAGDEISLFYFAGHGATTNYGAFLVTSDCKDRVHDGFDLGLLTRMVQSLSPTGAAVVIILDCCHSGAMQLSQGSFAVAITADDLTPYVLNLSRRRALLAACAENQLAKEDDTLDHGVFTHHILEGLLGDASNENGVVTVNAVYDYVAQEFESRHGQRPVFRGDMDGRIVLGEGLASQSRRSELEEIESTERLAEEHLQSLQSVIATSLGDRHAWHQHGYKDVCKQAAPILEWFDKRLVESSELSERERFQSAREELLAKVQFLSNVEPGLQSEVGCVESRLGSGSFGAVWKVRGPAQLFAVKVFHGFDLGIDEKVSRFRHGFSAMRKLEHPRIVKVQALYECPLSFSMDYIEGANFRDWTGAIEDPKEIVELLLRIVDTICHAHARGVVHRDIKPENIIMRFDAPTGRWEPFLTDFDLAWFSTASLQTRDALGTVFYAAPEQLAKPGTASSRIPSVDIFSIGQVIFYALTKSDPTPLDFADNVRALRDRIRKWPTARPADLLSALYAECTQRSPALRPKSMDDVSSRLYDVLSAFNSGDGTLTADEFLREVKFAVVGFGLDPNNATYISPAGQTRITVILGSDLVRISMQLERKPLVDNVSDFHTARQILNARVDAALRRFPSVTRGKGQSGYEVFINIPRQAYAIKFAAEIRSIVTSVLSVLERG